MSQIARTARPNPSALRTLVLCGGKGTRAYPHTLEVPKPLMAVGDEPILHHLIACYARQGYEHFVLAGGYLVEQIHGFAAARADRWSIEVVDTGEETGTAGRILKCAPLLGSRFFATYGDGLGNVDLGALLRFHESHTGSATVTVVPLPSPYGTIESEPSGRVTGFTEKPVLEDRWINAGFFVFDDSVFTRWDGDDLEREVLPSLAASGDLYAYRHAGFWKSMDTYKDALELSALCNGEDVPWMVSPEPRSSSPARQVSSGRT
jgi:glucose-1-phosphate cytidylyltransferase